MVIFSDVVKSLMTAWVNRYCKATDSHWCALLDSMLGKVGGALLFQCNYDLKFLDLKNLSAFYKNVLQFGKNSIPKIPLTHMNLNKKSNGTIVL